MKISDLTVTIVLAMSVLIGSGMFLGSMGEHYGVKTNSTFVEFGKNKARSLDNTSTQLRQDIKKVSEGGFIEKFAGAIGIGLTTFGTVFDLIFGGVITSIIQDLPAMLPSGLTPSWFIGGILLTALGLYVAYKIINFLRGGEAL